MTNDFDIFCSQLQSSRCRQNKRQNSAQCSTTDVDVPRQVTMEAIPEYQKSQRTNIQQLPDFVQLDVVDTAGESSCQLGKTVKGQLQEFVQNQQLQLQIYRDQLQKRKGVFSSVDGAGHKVQQKYSYEQTQEELEDSDDSTYITARDVFGLSQEKLAALRRARRARKDRGLAEKPPIQYDFFAEKLVAKFTRDRQRAQQRQEQLERKLLKKQKRILEQKRRENDENMVVLADGSRVHKNSEKYKNLVLRAELMQEKVRARLKISQKSAKKWYLKNQNFAVEERGRSMDIVIDENQNQENDGNGQNANARYVENVQDDPSQHVQNAEDVLDVFSPSLEMRLDFDSSDENMEDENKRKFQVYDWQTDVEHPQHVQNVEYAQNVQNGEYVLAGNGLENNKVNSCRKNSLLVTPVAGLERYDPREFQFGNQLNFNQQNENQINNCEISLSKITPVGGLPEKPVANFHPIIGGLQIENQILNSNQYISEIQNVSNNSKELYEPSINQSNSIQQQFNFSGQKLNQFSFNSVSDEVKSPEPKRQKLMESPIQIQNDLSVQFPSLRTEKNSQVQQFQQSNKNNISVQFPSVYDSKQSEIQNQGLNLVPRDDEPAENSDQNRDEIQVQDQIINLVSSDDEDDAGNVKNVCFDNQINVENAEIQQTSGKLNIQVNQVDSNSGMDVEHVGNAGNLHSGDNNKKLNQNLADFGMDVEYAENVEIENKIIQNNSCDEKFLNTPQNSKLLDSGKFYVDVMVTPQTKNKKVWNEYFQNNFVDIRNDAENIQLNQNKNQVSSGGVFNEKNQDKKCSEDSFTFDVRQNVQHAQNVHQHVQHVQNVVPESNSDQLQEENSNILDNKVSENYVKENKTPEQNQKEVLQSFSLEQMHRPTDAKIRQMIQNSDKNQENNLFLGGSGQGEGVLQFFSPATKNQNQHPGSSHLVNNCSFQNISGSSDNNISNNMNNLHIHSSLNCNNINNNYNIGENKSQNLNKIDNCGENIFQNNVDPSILNNSNNQQQDSIIFDSKINNSNNREESLKRRNPTRRRNPPREWWRNQMSVEKEGVGRVLAPSPDPNWPGPSGKKKNYKSGKKIVAAKKYAKVFNIKRKR